MESARELFIGISKFKPDAVRFKVLLGDRKEPSYVKWEPTLCPSASRDPSRMELVEEDMLQKNMAREPAEPTLQRQHNARRVKARHHLSTTKLTLHKHLL